MQPLHAALVVSLLGLGTFFGSFAWAERTATDPSQSLTVAQLDQRQGTAVDLTPWAYVWRSDRAVQEQPEAYFIPRRLARIDKVYRTAATALPPDQLKSLYYNMPDLLTALPPAPKGQLQAALLWTGGVSNSRIELHWPASVTELPSPESVDVRIYPTSWGWFGWTVDRVLGPPEISADRHTWIYQSPANDKMDSSYSNRVDAATEMVAVFYESPRTAGQAIVPTLAVTSPCLGQWKRIDVELQWGFLPGTEKNEFDGRLEAHVGLLGPVAPLAGDTGTKTTGPDAWQSRAAGAERRGIVIPLLYAPDSRRGLDTRVTVWTKASGFTFRVADLDNGPIFIPSQGVLVTRAGSGVSGPQFVAELKSKKLQSVREKTREHREAASWQEALQEVRLWTCPEGTVVPPAPEVDDPPMQVRLSDAGWTNAWRAASHQLTGKHMWGGLAFEVGRVVHEMDLVGRHEQADKVYEHFLKAPGAKPDGDYSDGEGALEWATAMRHDMGYSHDGTHASTGRVLFALVERYMLTGDRDWFEKNLARMQKAADWILRQRHDYLKEIPNRQQLLVAGLMPPCQIGDYVLPACDWHWYYVDNALSLQAIQRLADALADFDAAAAKRYRDEAEAFRGDLRRAIDRDVALAPVRQGQDGLYHRYLPRMAYAAGIPGLELGAPHYPNWDWFVGSLPLAEPWAALEANDPRMIDTLDLTEEMGTSLQAVQEQEAARRKKGLPTEDAWFWLSYAELAKASHVGNLYLLQDDVPNFLRFWTNSYLAMVGSDGKFWEHWQWGNYNPCTDPDNGTAGWFLELFRNLVVMEEGQTLWIARATPRSWLEQGKSIAVQNAPTYFGDLAYEIVSDVDHGRITATVEIPARRPAQTVLVRLRHPEQKPLRSVTVNGQPWSDFDAAKEVVRLHDVKGSVRVEAAY